MKIRSVKKDLQFFLLQNDVNWAEMYFLRKTLKKIITIYFQFQGQKKSEKENFKIFDSFKQWSSD